MMDIKKKFLKVMMECSRFNQSGVHEHYKYKYSTIEDVLGKMNEVLTKNGLISIIKSKLVDIKEVKTSKGSIEQMIIVEVTNTIMDIESTAKLEIVSLGSGTDCTKAQINGIKYGYILSCCSITGTGFN